MNHRFVAVASHYHLLLLELLSNLRKQTNIVGCCLANSWWWSKHRGHPGFWEWRWQFCGDKSGNLKICHQSRLYRLNKTQKINNRQDFTFWKGGIDFFWKIKTQEIKERLPKRVTCQPSQRPSWIHPSQDMRYNNYKGLLIWSQFPHWLSNADIYVHLRSFDAVNENIKGGSLLEISN